MVLDFSWLPPEINSARIFTGAGTTPLFTAARAWDGLAQELQASASSFHSVITQLTAGPWSGPASTAMAAAAAPYALWLNAAAERAAGTAGGARAAATAFETALAATVHPALVTANRETLASLAATNFLGQNSPTIAATEFEYMEMWAQDVGAMLGYHSAATSAASTLAPFSVPPASLSGLTAWASQAALGISSALPAPLQGIAAEGPALMSMVQSLPLQSLSGFMYPLSMAMYPLSMIMGFARMGGMGGAAAGPAGGAALAHGVAPAAHAALPAMKPLGGGGLGAAMSAGLGKARMVGALSVPSTWQGSMPTRLGSSAMSGLGGMNATAAMQGADAASAGRMMPMPMPMGGMGAGAMPGGMMGRGGASPQMPQQRPTVIPRTGV
ncbi:PPE family protein [Mycobacterium interjectum]|uniref:PPE family protein n=2 Tax=Mycobacterium interjectum TaxID=33895 RepID=UPI0021F29641|nr:PPE family protein [Mycobacterium interjectum]MCV7088615.1 PPE family protein [Mycobacterium interjectum]